MAHLTGLADAISRTLSPDQTARRDAEVLLDRKSCSPGFSVALLQLIALETAPQHIRQAAAVYMKNHTIKTYSQPDWQDQPSNQRDAVKSAILDIMLSAPVVVRRQLSEVLAIVSEHEYPTHWPRLVPDISNKLTAILQEPSTLPTGADILARLDWIQLQGILETLHAVFERYPERMRSDELYTEINYSLQHTQELVKALFVIVNKVIADNFESRQQKFVEIVLQNVDLLCKILYCLSWQELPAYFEDHLQEYMTELRKLLVYESPVIDAMNEDEPSPLSHVQASVLEITNLYATKYDEEFRPFLKQFLSDAWSLLVKRSNATKYDGVVTTGIKFLTSVSRSPDYHLFSSESSLSEICKQIVIPNIKLRDEDVELFEDNPVEYIRRDMEGSDTGTRRRGAVELVKGLCANFEQQVTNIFSGYVQEMLAPQAEWRMHDTAIYVVTALGWKSGTLAGGATETSSLINVVDFFNSFVMPQLNRSGENASNLETPIFTADLIKFVISFRNQIPKEGCGNVIMVCGKLLSAKEPVVRTYAAACIERILTVKDTVTQANGTGANANSPSHRTVPRMTKTDVIPVLPAFVPAVLKAFQDSTRADEYLMRLVLRFCAVAQDGMGPYLETLITSLKDMFVAVAANPANPLFNHYLLEAISALIRFNGNESTVSSLEGTLLGPMRDVLTADVTEFAPYVFQVMGQLMMVERGASPLPSLYGEVLGPVLSPSLWDRKGYIPGMVQFIECYTIKSKDAVVANNQLDQILGVVQRLLAWKSTDHHGMRLLDTILEAYDLATLGDRIKRIFEVLMVRLRNARTPKYVTNLICSLSAFALKHGAGILRASLDSVQVNLLEMLLTQVWLPEVAKIRNSSQRRQCALALTEIACGSDLCTAAPYFELWPLIVNANAALTEGIVLDQDKKTQDTDAEEETVHLGGGESYSAAHSQLKWGLPAGPRISSATTGKDPRSFLATKLSAFTAQYGAQFSPIFEQRVDARAREAIVSYATPQPAA